MWGEILETRVEWGVVSASLQVTGCGKHWGLRDLDPGAVSQCCGKPEPETSATQSSANWKNLVTPSCFDGLRGGLVLPVCMLVYAAEPLRTGRQSRCTAVLIKKRNESELVGVVGKRGNVVVVVEIEVSECGGSIDDRARGVASCDGSSRRAMGLLECQQ